MAKSDLIGGALWDEYSSKVASRMNDPKHRGEISQAEATLMGGKLVVADFGAEACGDAVRLFWVVDENEKIVAAKFKSFGCGTAIAASDMMVELCIGKTVKEALTIDNLIVEKHLRDDENKPAVPPQKMHCSVMAHDAIKEAAANFYGVDRSVYEDSQIVCECARVRIGDIKDAIRINNLSTLEEVTQYTKAGGFCKSCLRPGGHEAKEMYIEDILRDTLAEMAKEGKQQPKEASELTFEQMSIFQKGKHLQEFFTEVISPMLAMDGGAAELGDFYEENNRLIVHINYKGACVGCASSATGTLMAIQNLLKQEVSNRIDVRL
ncbi:iron-sulfur cluster assembly scaffold protein [Entomospira culicis]|uniref:Nitrogen fixation protein NifU n=1 Tax=Entomospira culicis TaxID=2719989 RepID=A0A968GGX3_9SPIO|nr:iron-sulfur cluster assembly scaffold protein [Entomospira culicis]NIZ18622.1 iron-sulfur cluster assembly scaffold protein NifU [Entomospira culicis]NIZ68837.1 iron-sulfur cluster assembly scaffold protein NifU [Entomospira culicis]WDI37431.1 iron-sulfur cluster assembly scaffold protein [Entomospira culicis]WDI39059.1 iron-sulfur cluster assembly scaffold protein [Entomospira culicis]